MLTVGCLDRTMRIRVSETSFSLRRNRGEKKRDKQEENRPSSHRVIAFAGCLLPHSTSLASYVFTLNADSRV